MLEIVDIDAGYGRTGVLQGVSIPGSSKVVAVLGHNGAGKTTLLRATIGLIRPTRGRVLFDGEDVTRYPAHVRAARGLQILFPLMIWIQRSLSGGGLW